MELATKPPHLTEWRDTCRVYTVPTVSSNNNQIMNNPQGFKHQTLNCNKFPDSLLTVALDQVQECADQKELDHNFLQLSNKDLALNTTLSIGDLGKQSPNMIHFQ